MAGGRGLKDTGHGGILQKVLIGWEADVPERPGRRG